MCEYKYKAFISYRREDFDKKVAKRLQNLLERYSIPKQYRPKSEKIRWKIFRDEDELVPGSLLSESIKKKLEESEFLIIICSKRINQTSWCNKELRYFIDLHDGSTRNVLPVLIDGTPITSFPTELWKLIENGEAQEKNLLALNIVQATNKQSIAVLNKDYIHLAAGLLKLESINDLVQREEKRKRNNIITIITIICTVFSIISVIILYSYLKVNEKNKEISQQNKTLEEKNQQIAEQNYALLLENSEALTAQSQYLWQNGKPIEAIEKILSALPSEKMDRPVSVDAVYQLSTMIGVFYPQTFLPTKVFKHKSRIASGMFMSNGNHIISKDATGIYYWDTNSGSLLAYYPFSDSYKYDVGYFLQRDGVCFDEIITLHDYYPGREVADAYGKRTYSNENEEALYIYDSNNIFRINLISGEVMWEYPIAGNKQFAANSNYFLVVSESSEENVSASTNDLTVIDTDSGNIFAQISTDYSLLGEICGFSSEYIYHWSSNKEIEVYRYSGGMISFVNRYSLPDDRYKGGYVTQGNKLLYIYSIPDQQDKTYNTNVVCIEMETNDIIWNSDFVTCSQEVITNGIFNSGTNTETGFLVFGDKLLAFNLQTGEQHFTCQLEEGANTFSYSDKGFLFYISANDYEKGLDLNPLLNNISDTPVIYMLEKQLHKSFITQADLINNYEEKYLISEIGTNLLHLYELRDNASCIDLNEKFDNSMLCSLLINEAGTYAAANIAEKYTVLYDAKTFNEIKRFASEIGNPQYFINNNWIVLSNYDYDKKKTTFFVYDIASDEIIFKEVRSGRTSEQRMLYYENAQGQLDILHYGDNTLFIKDDYLRREYSDNKEKVVIYSITTGRSIIVYDLKTEVEILIEPDDTFAEKKMIRIIWMDNQTIAACYSDYTVAIYDVEQGECIYSTTLKNLYSEISDVTSLHNGSDIVFVCMDQVVYRANIYEAEIKDYDTIPIPEYYTHRPVIGFDYIPEKNILVLLVNMGPRSNVAWLIDIVSFKTQYFVEYYWGYLKKLNMIVASHADGVYKCYPFYSVEELVTKGNEYLYSYN